MTSPMLKDSTQIRGISQSLILWAQNDDDWLPLPSEIDALDLTVAGVEPLAKDTTGNIYSILIFSGLSPAELFVSPHEVAGNIEEFEEYELSDPELAAVPSQALWDPAFRSSPEQAGDGPNAGIGHTSYAHALTFGPRRAEWRSTFSDKQAVIANRGPEYVGESGRWSLARGERGEGSNTLGIHGDEQIWSGNIVYGDNHVDFEDVPDPDALKLADGQSRDNLFVNEDDASGRPSDDLDQANAFLRIVHGVTASREVVGEDGDVRREPTLAWADLFVD